MPILNLMIQIIDRVSRSPMLRRVDLSALVGNLTPSRRNLAYMSVWGVIFVMMQVVSGSQITLARADIMLAQGRIADSITHYRELVRLEPGNAPGHTKLGFALIQVGRVQEALPLLRRAIALQPDNPEAHNNLGLALMQVGQTKSAVTSMQRAVQLRSDYAEGQSVSET